MAEIIDLHDYKFDKWARENIPLGTSCDVMAERIAKYLAGNGPKIYISIHGFKNEKKAEVIRIHPNKEGDNGSV